MDKKDDEKKERLLAALDKGLVMLHLDARRPGVLVPPALRNEAHLRLNVSYRFDPPDLTVGQWGIRCTLSFSGSRFTVAVPWSALFAMTSHVTKEFWMYPDDMPPELWQQTMVTERVPTEKVGAEQAPKPEESPRPPVVLREVPGERSGEEQGDGEPEPQEPTPPRRGHLRLVK
jgi:stringent starvation protein B